MLAYDGFNDAPVDSDLLGKGDGFGFSGGWVAGGFNASISTNYDIALGSLGIPNLATTSNSVRTDAVGALAGVTRPLIAPLGAAGSTVYFSLVLRPLGTLDSGAFGGFFGLALESPGEPELFIGKTGVGSGARYVLEDRGGSGRVPSTKAPVVNESTLLVVRAQFGAASDIFTLYVNPAPGGAQPTTGFVKSDTNISGITGLTIYATGAFGIDELRVGQTFGDVTPVVPEPGATTLLLAGVPALLACRRKRAATAS